MNFFVQASIHPSCYCSRLSQILRVDVQARPQANDVGFLVRVVSVCGLDMESLEPSVLIVLLLVSALPRIDIEL